MNICLRPSVIRPSVRCRATKRLKPDEIAVLERYWKSKGVVDQKQRCRLIHIAEERRQSAQLPLKYSLQSGLFYAWNLDQFTIEICQISESVLNLMEILGNGADVVWMCSREPELLNMSRENLIRRLLDMKLSLSGTEADVLQLVEQSPRLLLKTTKSVNRKESPSEQIPAWEHGLVSDRDESWLTSFATIERYYNQFGHSHVGFVEGDDVDLVAWTAKQRSDYIKGVLSSERGRRLEAVEFEFKSVDAEWRRWFYEWKSTRDVTSSVHWSYLTHWSSVQRIAQKSGKLALWRKRLLDGNGFDWNAPDPLS